MYAHPTQGRKPCQLGQLAHHHRDGSPHSPHHAPRYYRIPALKLLINCSPFGATDFLSDAYFGRIDDEAITHACGVLNEMHKGMSLCADKGFILAAQLMQLGCGLVQPEEKPKNKRFSKKALLYSRRVSRVRIHIERWVRRIKERSGFLHKIVPTQLIHLVFPIAGICTFMANYRKPIWGGE